MFSLTFLLTASPFCSWLSPFPTHSEPYAMQHDGNYSIVSEKISRDDFSWAHQISRIYSLGLSCSCQLFSLLLRTCFSAILKETNTFILQHYNTSGRLLYFRLDWTTFCWPFPPKLMFRLTIVVGFARCHLCLIFRL